MKNYLVFIANDQSIRYENGRRVETGIPVSYQLAFGVKAKNPEQACMAVMSHTKQIGRYAAIEAEFINFEDALTGNLPDEERPSLNP